MPPAKPPAHLTSAGDVPASAPARDAGLVEWQRSRQVPLFAGLPPAAPAVDPALARLEELRAELRAVKAELEETTARKVAARFGPPVKVRHRFVDRPFVLAASADGPEVRWAVGELVREVTPAQATALLREVALRPTGRCGSDGLVEEPRFEKV